MMPVSSICFMQCFVRDGSHISRGVVGLLLLLHVLFKWTNGGGSSPEIPPAWPSGTYGKSMEHIPVRGNLVEKP